MLICTEGIGISLRGGGGACKSKNFKAMYGAKLELSEWVGDNVRKNPVGVKISSGTTQCRLFWEIIFVLANKVWKAMEAIFTKICWVDLEYTLQKKFF